MTKKQLLDSQIVIKSEFFNNSPISAIIWNSDKNQSIFEVSSNISNLLGYTKSDFISGDITYSSLIHSFHISKIEKNFLDNISLKNKNFTHPPYRIKNKNKKYIWVEENIFVIYKEDKIINHISYISDCTKEQESIKKLRESKQVWVNAIENNGDGLWEWNMVTNKVYFSPQWKKMFGYNENEISNCLTEWESRVHPQDIKRVKEEIQNYLDGNTHRYASEHRVLCKDGEYKWILDRGCITKYSKDLKAQIFTGTHIDITEKKEVENKLDKSLSYNRVLIDNLPFSIWLKDKDSKFLKVNKSFAKATKLKDPKFLIDKNDYEVWPKRLASKYVEDDIKVLKSGKSKLVNEEVMIGEEKKWLETFKAPVYDKDNELLGSVGYSRDISEVKKYQDELMEQKKEFEAIFNNSKDAISILDLESNFLNCNHAQCELVAYSKDELLKMSCLDLTLIDEKEESILQEIINKGFIKNFEKKCLTKDKEVINVNMSASLLPDKKRILLITRDVSQTKLLEEQSKLIAMGEMIGNIAHQWRQPLSVISTASTGLKLQKQFNTLCDEELSKTCDVINENAQYLSNTIEDFKNFIRDDDILSLVSIKETLDYTMHLTEATMKNNYIKVIAKIDDDLEIYANKNELVQSFINILNNAKDALQLKKEEERYLIIETKKLNKNIEITICDNGDGIPKEVIKRIFEPYYTTKHKSLGTGIGLSMTSKILRDKYSASIKVYNNSWEYNNKKLYGACFKITLK